MLEHILRRMGFGVTPEQLAQFANLPVSQVILRLLNYESQPADVDSKINNPAYVGVTTRGQFSPDLTINDTRQRWLFRMIHSQRPLEEKMALFWHNHFATGYTKLSNQFGALHGAKMMDASPANFNNNFRGQVQLFRDMAVGNFRDLLIEVAKDPAMITWLDGRTNTKAKPQENFARELMELFTTGLGHYAEQDVYAAARVFTGWNIEIIGAGVGADRNAEPTSYYKFVFQPNQHDTNAKEFTFPINSDGTRTIPARAAANGMQDGIDLINALASHPATAQRLANKLWRFFVSETTPPPQGVIDQVAQAYLSSNFSIKAMLQRMLLSDEFLNGSYFQRYSWPVEYVVRAIREMGWTGLSVDTAMTPLVNMGQTLYEPPDVNGWELGPGWISTSSMLARMNFSSTLAGNQKFNLARDAQPYRETPEKLMAYLLARFPTMGFSDTARIAMLEYLRSGPAWTGSDAQLQAKTPGLARLIVGAGEYQFN
jgi:uncharacterized protein (DUF1800 family)